MRFPTRSCVLPTEWITKTVLAVKNWVCSVVAGWLAVLSRPLLLLRLEVSAPVLDDEGSSRSHSICIQTQTATA